MIFSKHARINEMISQTYLDIIELCAEIKVMIKTQQKSLIKRTVQPLCGKIENKLKDAEARFRTHTKNVEKEAELCHMLEASESRELILRNKLQEEKKNKAETRRKHCALLSSINTAQKHEKVRNMRHRHTGNWLFATTEYKSWMESKVSSVICCYGGLPLCMPRSKFANLSRYS